MVANALKETVTKQESELSALRSKLAAVEEKDKNPIVPFIAEQKTPRKITRAEVQIKKDTKSSKMTVDVKKSETPLESERNEVDVSDDERKDQKEEEKWEVGYFRFIFVLYAFPIFVD